MSPDITDIHYVAQPINSYDIGSGFVLVTSSKNHIATVTSLVARIAELCLTPRTLDEHAAFVASRMPAIGRDALDASLQALLRGGLLVPFVRAERPTAIGAPIDTVAILAMKSPERVRESLYSYIAHCIAYGHSPRFVIVDEATEPDVASANAAIAASATKATGLQVAYFGVRKQLQLIAASGLNAAALQGQETLGRNAFLLFAAGQRVLIASDSTRCEVWRHPDRTNGLSVGGHREPRRHEFFTDYVSAQPPSDLLGGDLMEAASRMLGKELQTLLDGANAYDTVEACSHMIGLMAGSDPAVVRMLIPGTAGDAGLRHPFTLLAQVPPSLMTEFVDDEDAFDTAMLYRAMRRVATQWVVTHDLSCEWPCVFLDNTVPLPPFVPSGTERSIGWRRLLSASQPTALLAHLPLGVTNQSGRPPLYGGDSGMAAGEITCADVLEAALTDCGLPARTSDGDAAQGLKYLGRHLLASCSRPTREWSRTMRDLVVARRASYLLALDPNGTTIRNYPEHCKAALAQYREIMLAALDSEDFLPNPARADGTNGTTATQAELKSYATLLVDWADAWTHSRDTETERILTWATV